MRFLFLFNLLVSFRSNFHFFWSWMCPWRPYPSHVWLTCYFFSALTSVSVASNVRLCVCVCLSLRVWLCCLCECPADVIIVSSTLRSLNAAHAKIVSKQELLKWILCRTKLFFPITICKSIAQLNFKCFSDIFYCKVLQSLRRAGIWNVIGHPHSAIHDLYYQYSSFRNCLDVTKF